MKNHIFNFSESDVVRNPFWHIEKENVIEENFF